MRHAWLVWVLALVAACATPNAPTEEVTVADALAQLEAAPLPERPIDIGKRPRPLSGFVPASRDTRSQADIDAAACGWPKEWWCKNLPRPKTFMAGSSSPIIPNGWTVPNWFVDPQNVSGNASDGNACTSSGAPCLTWQEINVHRWGCLGNPEACPRIRQNTSVTFLSSHTNNSDPVYLLPVLENGANFNLQGTTPAATAAVFTRSSQKNRTAGANALLAGSFSAGAPAAGVMVQNTTAAKSSIAYIHSSAGGANWNMTQPLAPSTVPTSTLNPAEVDTWASTDTVNLLSPVAINLVEFTPMIIDASTNNYGYLFQCAIFDPQGVGQDSVFLNGGVQSMQVVFQRGVTMISDQATVASGSISHDSGFIDDYFLGGIFTTAFVDTTFIMGGGTNNFSSFVGEADIDGDYVAGGFGFNFLAGGSFVIGFVFLDANSIVAGGASIAFKTSQYGGHAIYGTTGKNMNFRDKSSAIMTGTFTAGWTQATLATTGVQLNGASTGCSHSNANNPDVQNCAISTTVAHLDAAQGIAGFGGTAYNPGGASVSNVYQ